MGSRTSDLKVGIGGIEGAGRRMAASEDWEISSHAAAPAALNSSMNRQYYSRCRAGVSRIRQRARESLAPPWKQSAKQPYVYRLQECRSGAHDREMLHGLPGVVQEYRRLSMNDAQFRRLSAYSLHWADMYQLAQFR